MAQITDADKVLRNDTGKSIASKLDDIKTAIQSQSTTLNNLSDVSILSVQDGQFLKYNSTENKWVNVSLPDPMVFKGTLGTGGTITVLPVDGSANIGDTYKVIEDGTYAGVSAKVGDLFSCLTKSSSTNTWVLIPSGDESFTDTWRGIKVNGTEKLTSSISSGEVDFVAGTNIQIAFDSTGNKITISASDVYTKSETDTEIVNGITSDTYNSFDTNEKTVIGAVNEVFDYTTTTTDTASGSIATFDTSLALPLQDCTIAINAVQESGTPTPSSPKAISGFTGANIRVVGLNFWDEITEDGYISGSGTEESYTNAIRSKNYSPCIPSTQYYPNTPTSVFTGSSVCWYDKNKAFIRRDAEPRFSVTSPANAFYFRLSFYNYKATYPSYANNISLNYPATDKTYHAYNANSTTTAITWNDEAGTVYGGSLDVTSGVLTVTWHAIDLGSLTWTYDAGSVPSNPYFFCQRDTVKNSTQNLLCSIYQLANVGVASMPNYSMKSNNKGQVLIVNHDYSDENTFKTAMSGVLLVCEKLTPVTYQLTSTQISAIVGTNNVFTDTNGNTSVVYYTKSGESIAKIASDISVNNAINHTYSELDTSSKTIIGGINENKASIGTLESLDTSTKTSIVNAINEIASYTPVYNNTASGSIATFDTSLALPLQDCTIAINGSGATGAYIGYCDFNQLNALNDVRFSPGASTGSITQNADNSVTITFTRNASDTSIKYPNLSDLNMTYDPSHIYLLYTDEYYNDGGLMFYIQSSGNYIPVGKNYRFYKNVGSSDTHIYVRSRINGSIDSVNITATVTMFDLTAMFGEYIANYIYNIEQDTEGAGCALFKALFPKDYYTSSMGGTKVTIDSVNGEPTCPNAHVSWQTEAGTVSEGSLNVTTGKLTVVNGSMGAGEYQITPIPINQLSGTNNIFCDTGNTSVVYACSLKDYIDGQ